MQVTNFGSINIDHVYKVNHFVRPGETLDSLSYQVFAGGKGFNQSIALARAGAATRHLGRVGKDAAWLIKRLEQAGVDTKLVMVGEAATGHAMIQIAPNGENAIVLHGGANRLIAETDIESALSTATAGDFLLLQNETSLVAQALQVAHQHGLRIVFNPAPMTAEVHQYPLALVDFFVLNETEAEELTGKIDPAEVRNHMLGRFPHAATVLTLGSKGAMYFDAGSMLHEPARQVNAIDTTAAGDTFIGYFLAEIMQHANPTRALEKGCRAAEICVTRTGAADSIPWRHELAPA